MKWTKTNSQKLGARASFLLALVVFSFGIVNVGSKQTVSAASPGDVVINELMYNPNTGNQDDEFLELYNTTGSSIDLGGWSFSQGITLTFAPGTTITAGGYLLISPNATNTMTTYNKATSGTYTGNLNNGGETVTLVDNTSAIMDTVTYSRNAPWPLTPAGTGRSLELKAPNLDNSLAASWAGSVSNGGTPLAQNSVFGLSLPSITNVTDPNNITAGQAVNITATITGTGITSVILKYKIGFTSDITVTMFDDGAHNDGGAGDNVYGATAIPAQSMNTLVRFRIEATNASGTQSSPSVDDSMTYNGYYVKDPSASYGEAPVLQWFITDADYDDMYAQADLQLVNQYPAVIVYANEVYDNASVRVKGSNTLGFPKKSLKVDLPAGHTLTYPGMTPNIKEFHLNANYKANEAGKLPTVYWAMEQGGLTTTNNQITELRRNGQFEGAYVMVDKYQSQWRQANGYNGGQLFEDYFTIENGASNANDLDTWKDHMTVDRKDAAKRDHVLDENNIPALINYMAMAAITQHYDFTRTQNIFYYRSNSTERWEVLPWDHDGDLISIKPKTTINVYDNTGVLPANSRFFLQAIYDQPDLRAAYYRRLGTLVDRFYTNDGLLDKYEEFANDYADLNAADQAKWQGVTRETKDNDLAVIARLKLLFGAYYRDSWAIPSSQTLGQKQAVSIDEVVASATNSDEYIKLSNGANTPVDISDWVVEGINYTIPAGSVIPANSSMYLLRDDKGYRASHTAVLVAGQYDTDLGSSGSLILKTDANVTIDNYAY